MKWVLALLLAATPLAAENLKYTIKGQDQEKAELETLSPSPDIPKTDKVPFWPDPKNAIDSEVVPASISKLAMSAAPAKIQPPMLPLIQSAPFIVQPIPPADDPAWAQVREFAQGPKAAMQFTGWSFLIVDGKNNEIFRQSGLGSPPKVLRWDGKSERGFMVSPNETYFSFIELNRSTETIARIPGEAQRFLCYSRIEGHDEVVYFGERIYKSGGAEFSDEGRIYLYDLSRRLSQVKRYQVAASTEDVDSAPLQNVIVNLYEPESNDNESVREARKATWKRYIENVLGETLSDDAVSLHPFSDAGSAVRIILRNFADPQRPDMTGISRDPRPQFEDTSSWVKVKRTKEILIVDLRHDRLFRPGTAYLRDEALPKLSEAIVQMRDYISNLPLKKRGEPGVLLRSYMEKPREKKKGQTEEEDPKLAALRSKILFMLFTIARNN